MRVISYPGSFPLNSDFPKKKVIFQCEGGCVYAAEKEGRYFLITDEGGMSDFLTEGEDDDLLKALVKVYEFDDKEERSDYIQQRGWNRRSHRRDWEEGIVDPGGEHIKITHAGNPAPIALVAEIDGRITVQFLNESLQDPAQRESVIKELNFYFVELEKDDPWEYAIYHCSAAANIYSDVRWSYYPEGWQGE